MREKEKGMMFPKICGVMSILLPLILLVLIFISSQSFPAKEIAIRGVATEAGIHK